MANYYTQFSFVVPVPSERIAKALARLHQRMAESAVGAERWPADRWKDPLLKKAMEDPGFDVSVHEGTTVWIHSDEGGLEGAVAFTQYILRRYHDHHAAIVVQWAATCSKPRLDAFGGGCVYITQDFARYENSFDTARKLAEHYLPQYRVQN